MAYFSHDQLHRPVEQGPALIIGELGEHGECWVEGKRIKSTRR